jgi:hypothetical protein
MLKRISSILNGISGEYFVAAELSRQGYVASITLRNTRGIDVLASNADASKSVGIQVKTNRGRKRAWIMSKKAEDLQADNLFYVFVSLNDGDQPDFYVVPSKAVAEQIRKDHEVFLARPGPKGQQRKDSSWRWFGDRIPEWEHRRDLEQHRNRWDLLRLDEVAQAAA